MMEKLNQALFLLCLVILSSCQTRKEQANYQVIPLPQEVVPTEGSPFVINEKTVILYTEGNELQKRNAEFLATYLNETAGKRLSTAVLTEQATKNTILLMLTDAIEQEEGYTIVVDENCVQISGKTEAGVFHGIQTLRKSIPTAARNVEIELPPVRINDYPRFGYRGMHLDVARHFFPVEFVKKYIDLLALHNMNTFHWHLTDDQGWRIEIKQYPKLTEISSMRKRTVIGRNTHEYDETPYGGFYTQEQIKEVIKYAQDRFITIIPEVDLPGHMLAVLAAYPEFGCTGGPYEVSPRWGIFDDVLCIGNEDAMVFLENVLTEVVDLFPSELIHIGGDEAPRTRWKSCPKCQARIRKEGLKTDSKHAAEDRLQTYCMKRMEKLLNEKGRRIIGWDEILEGDVAPHATIMSWRGMEGGIEAARLGHDVIMTPSRHVYFDYYQTDNIKDERLAIGGLLTLERVYSLEPVPAELTEEEKKHILGAQANLWSEYIHTTDEVEYMVLPRMSALAEVQWTEPEKKNYTDFTNRLPKLLNLLQNTGYNYAKHIFDIKAEYKPQHGEKIVEVTLSTVDDAPIYYTLNGTEPDQKSLVYNAPILITENTVFKAIALRPTGNSKVISEEISFNKATGRPISLKHQPTDRYKFNGVIALADGLRGNDSYSTGRWLGFKDEDLEAVIDLQQPTEISNVSTEALVDMASWIMGPTGLTVYVSDDKVNFREVASEDYPADTDYSKKNIDAYMVSFDPVTARYVKVIIKRSLALPKGHGAEGRAPFLFIDEIAIE